MNFRYETTMHKDSVRIKLERYCVMYWWDDSEETGVEVRDGLTKKEALKLMSKCERHYQDFVKKAQMMKVEEVIV